MAFVTKTRDSVCAGDDADAPHTHIVEINPSTRDTVEFVTAASRGYLASVNGVGHSWTAVLNGSNIARIRVDSIEPIVATIALTDENLLHFKYHSATY